MLACLNDVIFGYLGVIKFDIGFVFSFVFKNIHLLSMLKCLVHYLGLLVINILACDVL